MKKRKQPEYKVRYTFIDAWPAYGPCISPGFTVYEVREHPEMSADGVARSVNEVVPVRTVYVDEMPRPIAAIYRAYMRLESELVDYAGSLDEQKKRGKKGVRDGV